MNASHHPSFLKSLILLMWVCIVGLFVVIRLEGIHVRALPALVRHEVQEAGALGPVLIVVLYAALTVLFFPKGGLDILSGALYGPVLGSLIVIIGINLAGALIFWFGRFFGKRFVHEHGRGWVKKYNTLLREEGFMTILFMRLILVPFDLVSLGAGMSDISFRQYAWGTLFGSLPATVTLVVLGRSFGHPRSWILFGVLLVVSVGLAFGLRNLPRVRKMLYKNPSQDQEKK